MKLAGRDRSVCHERYGEMHTVSLDFGNSSLHTSFASELVFEVNASTKYVVIHVNSSLHLWCDLWAGATSLKSL